MMAFDERASSVELLKAKPLTDLERVTRRRSTSHGRPMPVEKHTPEKLTVTGLFAGIGGLEQGFRQAGHITAMLYELDPLARGVLKRNFPIGKRLLHKLRRCFKKEGGMKG
jgi:DNA (cytosine-5)-methyltransferase 1